MGKRRQSSVVNRSPHNHPHPKVLYACASLPEADAFAPVPHVENGPTGHSSGEWGGRRRE